MYKEVYDYHMVDYSILRNYMLNITTNVTSNNTFYLPHLAIKKERNGTVKWRIVFDPSSHEKYPLSLNNFLEAGPNLLPEILATLLHFRSFQRAIMGDEVQAFLQLSLNLERDSYGSQL